MKTNLLLVITFWLAFLTTTLSLSSCTPDNLPAPEAIQHTINISNEGKPFEYWLGQIHYDSEGQDVRTTVDPGTQITLSAIVPVINGVAVSPNFQVYQDGRAVELKKVTLGFFWYEVK